LDEHPPNTKFAVRSIFEAIEILARLMDSPSKNLNAFQVKNKLLPIALSQTTDAIEQQSTKHLFDGLADWVDAMHPYRHGQGLPDPVEPSIQFAVYALSTGAAALRMLLGIDRATTAATP